jgi:LmbE family N-acetylglucosaminyl deacetylase
MAEVRLFLEPHADDAALFGAYTLLEHRPFVLLCFPDSDAKYGAPEVRLAEEAAAMEILGCEWRPAPAGLAAVLSEYDPEHVWAPLPELGGHRQHNLVGEVAASLWPGRVTYYTTYTDRGRTRLGTEVIPEPGWQEIKQRALACFVSQIIHPSTRPHFVERGTDEYLVDPAEVAA